MIRFSESLQLPSDFIFKEEKPVDKPNEIDPLQISDELTKYLESRGFNLELIQQIFEYGFTRNLKGR